MKRWMLFIACMGGLMNSVRVNAQSEEEKRLIAASQADASPLYFNPDTKEVPSVEPGHFFDAKECNVRGGLPNFLTKLKAGKPVTIGYIGGSITQGAFCYRPQSAKFISSMFPGIKKTWLNAGVSGTGTDLAACRIHEQLLKYSPDLVFVEFAVNGAYAPGMEGIVRQIIRFNPNIDICFIYTLANGQTTAYQQNSIPSNIEGLEKVAEYYKLPSVHMGMEAAQLEKEGKLIWKGAADTANGRIVFSNDGIHPLHAGGNLYAAAIARAFIKMNKAVVAAPHALPAPLITDNWEDGVMIDPLTIASFDQKWTKVTTATSGLKQFAGWFPYIMKGSVPGASFSFRFKGTVFGFFDIGGPEVGQLAFAVDGKPVKLQTIAASGYRLKKVSAGGAGVADLFNSYCNNRYRGQYELIQVPDGEHEVTITISPLKSDKRAILGPKQLEDITANPGKYDQTVFYLGKILLRGTPLPPATSKPVATSK
ncbi:SGNH/GDSL hydrolase family protein [Filimonas effusa]|uniref:SGNH/GDSL hydrolase family protein n=1 Tax=Filimonas effusa TaxID=2508721 RepID=A0A4Q1DBV0_9BACT|nr:SGNH/GDSL hydrolase family protein [Filimonas effusa]RXK86964.1 SGNH/GDSL hydrolase family protein [Filimonas effusa]